MIAPRPALAALVALGAGVAIGAGLQLTLRGPALHEVALATTTITFPAHPRPARGTCPRSIATIGQLGGGYVKTRSPDRLLGVAASATGCTLAIWNPDGTYVSRDDGASWTHVLTSAALAHDVAVAADETVFVVAHDALVVARRDGRSAVRALPIAEVNRVATSGGWVMVAAARELAFSHDDGATWVRRAPPRPIPRSRSSALFVDAEGTIRLALGGETWDDPITLWIADGAGWRAAWTSPPHRAYADPRDPQGQETHVAAIDAYAFARDGTLAAEVFDHAGNRIFLVDPRGTTTTVAELPATLDFAGATLTGTHADFGARDGHGEVLFLYGGRGPVRLEAPVTHLPYGPSYQFTGRWIVGDLRPD